MDEPTARLAEDHPKPDHQTAIIGASLGGICAAVSLKIQGLNDFVILDKADDLGGSWRDNHYPGVSVDVPSFAYQFSFAPNPAWTRLFASGAEVLAYQRRVCDDFGLRPRMHFNTEVIRQSWDASKCYWRLDCADGTSITAQFVISAVGSFLAAKSDEVPGLTDFAGTVLRPSAWDHDVDLAGRRVAVIGTGSTAAQIVPAIAARAQHVDVYQRTPNWCLPKLDVALGPLAQRIYGSPAVRAALQRALLLGIDGPGSFTVLSLPTPVFDRVVRALEVVVRVAYRGYLRVLVADRATRAALVPSHGIMAKRPTFSDTFLSTFRRDNVSLVTDPIQRITPGGVATEDGTTRRSDVLVLATGYQMFSHPESYRPGTVVGRQGFDLSESYCRNGLYAYQGVAVAGLPNRWSLVGPYSWTGTSYHHLLEISAAHIVRVIAETLRRGALSAEVSREAFQRDRDRTHAKGRNIRHYFTEMNKGVRSYYVNSHGDVPVMRPCKVSEAVHNSRHIRFTDYDFTLPDIGQQRPEPPYAIEEA